MKHEFTAIVVPSEEGGFGAFCPEVPAANGQGETIEEAKADLALAIELVLDLMRERALREDLPGAIRETVMVG